MLLAPHPDDETLGAGALLCRAARQGCDIKVVFATDGDNNPWVQRIGERRVCINSEDKKRFGRQRRGEAINALKALGLGESSAQSLAWPDQGLTRELNCPQQSLARRLVSLICDFQPTLIICPSAFDLHPDHNALALILRFALKRIWPWQRPQHLLSYFAHPPDSLPGFDDILTIAPDQSEQAAKAAALDCHRTQKVCHKRMFKRAAC